MIKIFLLLMITLLFFSCSSPKRKDINKLLDIKIEEVVESIEIKDLQTLVIVSKISYLLTAMILGLFTGIVLVVSGVRAIGFSVLLASITCIFLIITMTLYLKIIAIIGIGVLLVGIYFLGKNIYDKSITEKDLVNSTQAAKRYISDEDKKTLKIELDKTQSKYTKEIVKKLKSE